MYLQKDEKILLELHGKQTGLLKALVEEAYAAGGKPFVHIFDYEVEGALIEGSSEAHMAEIASYELERMKDMDAYIDIRATDNISVWNRVSDEKTDTTASITGGPSIWRNAATTPSGPCCAIPMMPWPSWPA